MPNSAKSSSSPPSAMVSAPSTVIIGNAYRLDRTIGQGTYGRVKLAYDTRTGEKVAVKMLEKANIKNERQVSRIQREIRFLKLLHHPHIVKVYDVVETSDMIYIVMENAAGGELFDYIVTHKRVKEKEARWFFRQVLSAVDYCHQNAVIHRDLKPENLLLDAQKNIKIIDFGFGNTYKSDTLMDTFCGSPFYAAPEMILGKRYEGPEIDIWSLGIILFALVCGHLPFDDENMKELYAKISSGSYVIPDYVPAPCRRIIERMITVDPKKRASLEEIKNDKWVCEGYEGPPKNFLPIRTALRAAELNENILVRMAAFGFEAKDVKMAFEECHSAYQEAATHAGPQKCKLNPAITTYFLLSEMLIREAQRLKSVETPAVNDLGLPACSRQASAETSSLNRPLRNPRPEPSDTAHDRRESVSSSTVVRPQTAQHRVSRTATIEPSLNELQEDKSRSNSGSVPSNLNTVGTSKEKNKTRPRIAIPWSNTTEGPKSAQVTSFAAMSPYLRSRMPSFFGGAVNTAHVRAATANSNDADRKRTVGSASNISDEAGDEGDAAVGSPSRTSRARGTQELRTISGWFMNVQTTSNKGATELLANVVTVLTDLKTAGVTFERDPLTPWILSVEVQTTLFNQSIADSVSPMMERNVPLASPRLLVGNQLREPSDYSLKINQSKSTTHSEALYSLADKSASANSATPSKTSSTWSNAAAEQHQQNPSPTSRSSSLFPSTKSMRPSLTDASISVNVTVCFQIEVCKVPRLSGLHGLHFKRISGGIWNYKKVCNKLLVRLAQ